jgi:magnesium-transporting ATPase (P-type)
MYTLEFSKFFGSFFIIFNTIIPISLTITFEIAKGIQVFIIEKDKKMKSENENFLVLSLKFKKT